jgi:hypothetical protein
MKNRDEAICTGGVNIGAETGQKSPIWGQRALVTPFLPTLVIFGQVKDT